MTPPKFQVNLDSSYGGGEFPNSVTGDSAEGGGEWRVDNSRIAGQVIPPTAEPPAEIRVTGEGLRDTGGE